MTDNLDELARLPPLEQLARRKIVQAKVDKLADRIAGLKALHDIALIELSQADGFKPCIDCHGHFCTMNCSSAPGYIKVGYS